MSGRSVVVRIPAAKGTKFADGAWAATVGKPTPLRIADQREPEGWRRVDARCTSATVVEGGHAVELTFDCSAYPTALILGTFISSAEIKSGGQPK